MFNDMDDCEGQCQACGKTGCNLYFYCDKCSPKWIGVKDRLPEKGKSILLTDGIQIMIGFLDSINKKFTQINTWNDEYHENISYWMALPKPPKEVSKTESPKDEFEKAIGWAARKWID